MPPSRTKRERPDDDVDAFASSPGFANKRQRLMKSGLTSAPNTPKTPRTVHTVASAISGALAYGANLASRKGRQPGGTERSQKELDALYDVPDTDDERGGASDEDDAAEEEDTDDGRGDGEDTLVGSPTPDTPSKPAKSVSPRKKRNPLAGLIIDGTDKLKSGDMNLSRSQRVRNTPKKFLDEASSAPSRKKATGRQVPEATDDTPKTPSKKIQRAALKTTPKATPKAAPKAAPVTTPTKEPAEEEAREGEADEDEEDEDEEDEEVCAICSKPDSEPPNEILFCDKCDLAVHQQCYHVPVIPQGDWLCKSCAQGEAPSDGRLAPDIAHFDGHLCALQRLLLDRCAGRRPVRLQGQDEAYDKARQVVEQTVVAGEGNSMLVIGARGSGKTTLVESILRDLAAEHKEAFHVVRLSGFIHTDDKLALREIWRQLGKEMAVEDDVVSKTNNYADTLASLLALLSHPSEIAGTAGDSGVTSTSVVFVLDEFDLFATHARQTLLYNLFDIAQARKAPIAVLGLTTKVDVVESLEKRVKSRFSHRYVYLALPRSLPAFWDVCRQGLLVDDEDVDELRALDADKEGFAAFQEWWRHMIEGLRDEPAFRDQLAFHYFHSKSAPAFWTACLLPLARVSAASPRLQIGSTPLSLEPPDSKLSLLASLSELELALLIAAARLDVVLSTDTVNFAMAYDEYVALMGKQRVQSSLAASSSAVATAVGSGKAAPSVVVGGGARVWGRGVAARAWERLAGLGLLVPAGLGGARAAGGGGGLEGRSMWRTEVALEEIPTSGVRLGAVMARWCREI